MVLTEAAAPHGVTRSVGLFSPKSLGTRKRSTTMIVVAVGTKIRTAINGNLCTDLDDSKIATKGRIGLQVHSGGPMEVRFRNFQLELNPKFELKTVKQ